MKRFFVTLAIAFSALLGIAYLASGRWPEIVESYEKNARGSLFTAFLTLGSFLLTLKSTILQRLKDGFDCRDHEEKYLYFVMSGQNGRYYESLANMSVAISTCVAMALISSLLQLTLGFAGTRTSFSFCAAFPLTTLLLVFYLWIQIALAHGMWLKAIEEKRQDELIKQGKLRRPGNEASQASDPRGE